MTPTILFAGLFPVQASGLHQISSSASPKLFKDTWHYFYSQVIRIERKLHRTFFFQKISKFIPETFMDQSWVLISWTNCVSLKNLNLSLRLKKIQKIFDFSQNLRMQIPKNFRFFNLCHYFTLLVVFTFFIHSFYQK